ncbi:hypothetical protein FRC12_023800, partial [Ceratobasidium sp. 428]
VDAEAEVEVKTDETKDFEAQAEVNLADEINNRSETETTESQREDALNADVQGDEQLLEAKIDFGEQAEDNNESEFNGDLGENFDKEL